MGDPVRIDDVARFLVERAERPIEIVYTGLRPGEKLNEVLLGIGEVDYRPLHPLISHVSVPPLDPALLLSIDPTAPRPQIVASLKQATTRSAVAGSMPPPRAYGDASGQPASGANGG
jgi:FlaA1/EpsC-like NDP-sugar epimerase